MRVRYVSTLCFLLFVAGLPLFPGGSKEPETNWLETDYGEIETAARSTRVNFYMWGGSAIINTWVDTFVAAELRKRYDINLVRAPMDANVFVNKLLAEKQAGRMTGSIDLLWINGENFKNAMETGLLFGPFTPKLPNFQKNINPKTVEFDFGYPVQGYEAPYGRAQFVFEYDSEKVPAPPDSFAKLKAWTREHPGRFTYPQPPDFTGSAFIRQVFYAVTGGHEQYMKGFDRALFEAGSEKLWSYLNSIKPYLWQGGRSYPKDVAGLDTLFERGEVDLNMSYHQAHAQNKIVNGMYKKSVRTFIMKDGSIFNTHYTAIPFNAPNKPGAMVTANFLMSVDAQYSKNTPEQWGDFTVIDLARLSDSNRAKFERLDLGAATLPVEVLNRHGVPEIPSAYLELLESGWEQNVLRR